jgi:hypothetical protein
MIEPVGLILGVIFASAIVLFLIGRREAQREQRVADLRPEHTPVDRPTLNPANRPLVAVLYGLASELSRTPDALKDIARTIQIHTPDPVDEVTRERLARVLDEHAGVVKRGAQEVREAKETP